MKQRCAPNTRPAAAANQPVSYPNGCKLYDNTSYDHNQVVQASIFRFDVASDLSGSSSVGGWFS